MTYFYLTRNASSIYVQSRELKGGISLVTGNWGVVNSCTVDDGDVSGDKKVMGMIQCKPGRRSGTCPIRKTDLCLNT